MSASPGPDQCGECPSTYLLTADCLAEQEGYIELIQLDADACVWRFVDQGGRLWSLKSHSDFGGWYIEVDGGNLDRFVINHFSACPALGSYMRSTAGDECNSVLVVLA